MYFPRIEVLLFLSSSEIMAKISLYARVSVTGTNTNNIGKLLIRDGFEYKIRKGRRLFAVVELTFEQVEAYQMGISGITPAKDVKREMIFICQIDKEI